ncbi:alkaline ceramidase [Drepanopeziza brunnea f. sp. 'multigermtubi' MB_m1]|uniref:Alkaline ceramidase n=1 Tax=Marssonina brunnea f. sp. multigermtubi (strain MB_m1) TaxID=1072389 RepID=K1WU72_MARBU|nr:alkaline ceramidase [Drepanopeziza brunnea f. sp. 'multigermtubi' MB_m1]EKD16007.1 alkaline ceramidase [Drepanopeziza brunnea f. sp. 'multigermtubi' MB_m1]
MPFSLPSFKYPLARPDEGYWNPVTSTINWCEEDYYATIYSAEIVNTLTNLLFIWLGVKGIRNCMKHGHDSIFIASFLGYLLVGSGSFAFHSTLKYPMQLVDELSMIYTAIIMCYATFSFSQSRLNRILLGVGLSGLAVFITLYYHYLQDPEFHQNAFALLLIVIMARSTYVMEVNIRPSLKEKYGMKSRKTIGSEPLAASESVANDLRDTAILKNMWLMVTIGLAIFLGGFGIWNLDNLYCSTARQWRHQVGLPWGILLEGHGWWHLMTGVGAYYYIVWAIWLRHCLNERKDEFVLNWPSIWSIPEVTSCSTAEKSNGWSNGYYSSYTNGHLTGKANGRARGHGNREDRKSV